MSSPPPTGGGTEADSSVLDSHFSAATLGQKLQAKWACAFWQAAAIFSSTVSVLPPSSTHDPGTGQFAASPLPTTFALEKLNSLARLATEDKSPAARQPAANIEKTQLGVPGLVDLILSTSVWIRSHSFLVYPKIVAFTSLSYSKRNVLHIETPQKFWAHFIVFIGLSLGYSATPAWALVCKPPPLDNFRKLVQKTAVSGWKDDRVGLKALAKKYGLSENVFSGVGVFGCGRDTKNFKPTVGGTGSLVGCQNVVVTARHLLFDKNCRPLNHKFCRLFLKDNGQEKALPVDMKNVTTGECQPGKDANDWAVVKLQKDAPSMFPSFDLPSTDFTVDSRTRLVQVSGWSEDFTENGKYPPFGSECVGGGKAVDGSFIHQCDTGGGSSGAPMFKQEEIGRTISAVHTGSVANVNFAVPVVGELLTALKKACGK